MKLSFIKKILIILGCAIFGFFAFLGMCYFLFVNPEHFFYENLKEIIFVAFLMAGFSGMCGFIVVFENYYKEK